MPAPLQNETSQGVDATLVNGSLGSIVDFITTAEGWLVDFLTFCTSIHFLTSPLNRYL